MYKDSKDSKDSKDNKDNNTMQIIKQEEEPLITRNILTRVAIIT